MLGPRGSGKTSSARITAAYLNCEKENKPCQECPSCLSVFNGVSQSVTEIDAASHGLVDDIRDLSKQARVAHSGRYRVFIIDEVHSASREAFSALLKQLEEPPPNVLYILVTTEAHAIPSTIKSRCLSFAFNSLSDRDTAVRLRHVCEQEGIEAKADVLVAIARKSKGSLRDALMLLEHLSILEDASIEQFRQLWPDELSSFASGFIQSAKEGDGEAGVALIRSTFASCRDATLLIDSVLEYLSNQIIESKNGSKAILSPRVSASLIKQAWELRVKTRAFNPVDPILIISLWHLFSVDLSGGSSSTSSVSSIPATIINKSEDQSGTDLDEMLRGVNL